MPDKEKFDEEWDDDEFGDFDDEDMENSYYEYLENMYGHGYVSTNADILMSHTENETNIEHIIDADNGQKAEELPDGLSEEEAQELSDAYWEQVREWCANKLADIRSEKFNENSLYFAAVPEDLKKVFGYVVKELRDIAHKNGGYVEVDDNYSDLSSDATVTIISKGLHFEKDEMFEAIMRFFTAFSVSYADDNKVQFCFTRHKYYDVKEVKL